MKTSGSFSISDDLMSLLDGGMHADHPSVIIDSDAMFQEEIFGSGYTLRGRAARSRASVYMYTPFTYHYLIGLHSTCIYCE